MPYDIRMLESTPDDGVSMPRGTVFPDPDDAVITGTHQLSPDALQLFLRCSRYISLALAHALSKWWRHDRSVQAGFAEGMLAQVELEKVRAIAEIIGTLVRPDPPLRGYDDVVRRLVLRLDGLGVGGNLKIAQILARAGTKISRETVRRYRRTQLRPGPPQDLPSKPSVLRAKYVNHIWLADLTEIRSFLGLYRFKLVAVLDLFSRFPLAFKVFHKEPTAEEMLGVLDRAMRRHGRPRHFVSDQGSQFTSAVFRETLDALSIKQRFGAIGQYGSIAIIERFWRTLKELLGVRLWPPLSADHLEARTRLALMYYSTLRPHQGLGGATPAEVFLDEEPAIKSAKPPPRKCDVNAPGEEPLPLEVVFLDRERLLPVLMPKRKAA